MKNILKTWQANAARRADFRRIRNEIRDLPRAIALDLKIYPGDAERIAYRAVYGV